MRQMMKLDVNFALIQVIMRFKNVQTVFYSFCTEDHEKSSFDNALTISEPQITQVNVSKNYSQCR